MIKFGNLGLNFYFKIRESVCMFVILVYFYRKQEVEIKLQEVYGFFSLRDIVVIKRDFVLDNCCIGMFLFKYIYYIYKKEKKIIYFGNLSICLKLNCLMGMVMLNIGLGKE